MKALVLDKPGPPESLHIGELPMPEPGPGEVRIQVHAAGLNPVDYKMAARGYHTWEYPFVLGLDVAGTIDTLGPEVEGWQPGDRVMYHGSLAQPGGFAEYALTASHIMTPLPEDVSFVSAAALPCAGLTAYQTLFRKLHLKAEQLILVQAGAGGVGGFAVQLAARLGATVITTCSASNFAYVQGLGATHAIDYNTEAVPERVAELSAGQGVSAIVDTVSSETATAGLNMLAFGGGIACIAGLPDFSQLEPFKKAPSIHEIALGAAHLSGDQAAQEDLARMGRELMDLVSAKKVDPLISEIILLDDIPRALKQLAGRHVRGKIVATL